MAHSPRTATFSVAERGNAPSFLSRTTDLVAARQSVVLLKNDGALPLSATEKVAVLGECCNFAHCRGILRRPSGANNRSKPSRGSCSKARRYRRKLLRTSPNLYQNSADENYEFPVFRLTRNPLEGSTGIFATQFPSDRALASSWNPSLITEVYKKRGEEAFAVKPYSYFNVTDDIAAEGVSEDYGL